LTHYRHFSPLFLSRRFHHNFTPPLTLPRPEDTETMKLSELTVIVPTRNEEKNIARFQRSVPDAVELIVVDASEIAPFRS